MSSRAPELGVRARSAPVAKVSVAPMMDRTDRHFRALFRGLSTHTWLYTEMVTTHAILHGDRDKLLGFDPIEHPVVLQLGGDDPAALAECAAIGEATGYDEINLNCGCPSDRVQEGRFGACLMATPERVAEAVAAMRARVKVPVTVKHRIGIDDRDRYEDMLHFVDVVAGAGADRFIVHARKAVLGGLSPKENRTIPPLRPDDVHRLKRERPQLVVEINGGIRRLAEIDRHLAEVDGVMIGRLAFEDPFEVFSAVDARYFSESSGAREEKLLDRGLRGPEDLGAPAAVRDRAAAIEAGFPYMERWLARGVGLHRLVRHLMTWFVGQPGGRVFRQILSERSTSPGAGLEVLVDALAAVRAHQERGRRTGERRAGDEAPPA